MKKISIGILAVILIVGGYLYLTTNDAVTPIEKAVTAVETEIEALERELAEIDADIQAGRLDETTATAARTRIETRMAGIDTAVSSSNSTTLTASQRLVLTQGLSRLKAVLQSYQVTLMTIEAKAEKRSGNNRGRTLAQIAEDTFDRVEQTVDEAVPEFDATGDLDITPEIEAEVTVEVESETETDATSETATSSEEVIEPEDEEPASETSDTDEAAADDTAIEANVNASSTVAI